MQCVKSCYLRHFSLSQQIDMREAGINIIREMVIKSLSTLVLSEVLYMVAVHLNEITRRLLYFGRCSHFRQS